MAFDEIQFPPEISEGAICGPGHSTAIITLPTTDAEERTARADGARRVYDASKGVSSIEAMAAIQSFAIARRGALRGFRWKDWSDFSSATDGYSTPGINDQEIGIGDGTTVDFQLVKAYISGAISVSRRIEKPVSGSVRVAVDGVEAMSGWSVNTTSGLVTFSVAPVLGKVITAGFYFDVPVRFSEDADKWMKLRLSDFDNRDIPEINVIELRNELPVDDEYFYGGSSVFNPLASNITLTSLNGRVITVTPNASGRTITLPDPANMPAGGIHFAITNKSALNTVALKNEVGGAVATIAALGSVMCVIAVDAMGTKYWMAL